MAYFRVNSPNVIHEIIDGECVLINLETGSYYSIDSAGAVIWDCIRRGLNLNQVLNAVKSEYAGSPAEIERGIEELVSQLREEQLIVEDEHPQTTGQNAPVAAVTTGQHDRQFRAPVLHKYTDMEDLLLLDPIHDVDESGWPNKRKDE